jgi:V/A-type H+-transporting ATPase subunit E
MEIDKIREAILNRAKEDAARITEEARVKAKGLIEEAKKRRELELETTKKKILSAAHREGSKILAQASMKARQEILREKGEVIDEILERVKHKLRHHKSDKESLTHLIKETIDTFETRTKVKLFVTSKDLGVVREILREDSQLKERVMDVREIDGLGGVSAEDEEGRVRVDNSFDTRLETLMGKILPEIGKELFGVGKNCI